jgi:hypothetical protein
MIYLLYWLDSPKQIGENSGDFHDDDGLRCIWVYDEYGNLVHKYKKMGEMLQ